MHREFPYLECTSTFFDMLYKEYEIDFNPELTGEELSIKIDDEILNYIKNNDEINKLLIQNFGKIC